MSASGDDLDALKTRLGGGVTPPPARADDLDALRTRVEGAAAGARPPAVPAPSAGKPLPPDQLPPGHILDERLMVVRKIGEGGMGVVYEAIDTRTQARYAVKLLSAALAQDAAAVDAMAREVAAAQAVTHQNLLKVNYFADSGPYKYLVTEYLDGVDLSTHMARRGGRLPKDEALGIARQVAAGLDHLHEKGLAHLALTPQNVFISPVGEVRVLDFGFSRASRVQAQAASGGASPGVMLNMAPEQVRAERVDRRADAYAFGLMLSQLLTGALPFDAKSKKDVVAWHVNARHKTVAVGDEKLDSLVAACLSVDPAKRPLPLGKALDSPSAVSFADPSASPRRAKAWKWALGGGLVVVVGVGAWWVIAGRTRIGSRESAARAAAADSAPRWGTGDPVVQAAAERDFAQYKARCDASDLRGCVELGWLYRMGRGVRRNVTQAKDLFVRACDGGNLRGCARLGALYGDGLAVAKDFSRARQLYSQACDGGELLGCAILGFAYRLGEGVPRSYARARELLEQSCNGGELRGCFYLGAMYYDGEGVRKNDARARQLFEQACNGGEIKGCLFVGMLYRDGTGVPQDYARARPFFEQACNGGEEIGCFALGYLYDEGGPGFPQDHARARQLYESACNWGEMPACVGLGMHYHEGTFGVAQDLARARSHFEQGCNAGILVGCSYLGSMYYNGEGVPRDSSRGLQFFTRACDGGEEQACANLRRFRAQ